MKLVLTITLCCLLTLATATGPNYKQVTNYQIEQSESVIQASEGYYIWQTEHDVYTVQNGEQTQISPSALCPISTYFTYALQNDQYFCFVNGSQPNSIVVNQIDILTGGLISQTNYSDVFFPPFNAEMNGDFYEFINSSLPLGNFEAQIYNLALNKFVCSPVISYPSNLETLGSLPENEYYIFIANDPTTKIVTYWYFDCITAEVTEIPTNLEVSFITMDSFLNGQVVVSIVFTEVQGEQQVLVQTWDRSVLKNTYQYPLGPGNSILGTSCDFQVIDETSFFLTFGRGDILNLTVFDVNLDFTIQISATTLFPPNCGQFFPAFEPNTFWTGAGPTTIFFDYTNLEINSLVNSYSPTIEFSNGEVITVSSLGYFVTYGPGNSEYFSLNHNANSYYDRTGVLYLLNVECGICELTVFNITESSISSYTYNHCPCSNEQYVQILDAQLLSNGEFGVAFSNSTGNGLVVLVGNDNYFVDFASLSQNFIISAFPNYYNLEVIVLSQGVTFGLTTISLQTGEILKNYLISEIGFQWSVVKLNATMFLYAGNSLTTGLAIVFNLNTLSAVQTTKLPFLNNDVGGNPFVPLGINLEANPIVAGFAYVQLTKNPLSFPVIVANYLGGYSVLPNVESLFLFSSGNNQFYVDLYKVVDYPGLLYEVTSFTGEEKMKKKSNLRHDINALLHEIDIIA